MSTLEQVEERVAQVEVKQDIDSTNINILTNNHIELVRIAARLDKSLANHEKTLANHERILTELAQITARLERSHAEHEARMTSDERIIANHEVRMTELKDGLEEARRFNRQALRLYVMVARKANWLDDDDIREWENGND